MPDASNAAVYVVSGLLGSLAAVIGSQLLSGKIRTAYLFYGSRPHGARYFSPERVQLLAVTIWVAFNYFLTVLNSGNELPDVTPGTLALLGGSHAIYLLGKAASRLLPLFEQ